MHTDNPEFFTNLPETPAALNDDIARHVAPRWFSSDELKSLNVNEMDDFVFISELYMIQEITHAVCRRQSNVVIMYVSHFLNPAETGCGWKSISICGGGRNQNRPDSMMTAPLHQVAFLTYKPQCANVHNLICTVVIMHNYANLNVSAC